MAKTYTIPYSQKQAYQGTSANLGIISDPTNYYAGDRKSGSYTYHHAVHCLFDQLSAINADNVTGITLHLQRLVGGSNITYSVTLYYSILSNSIAADDASGRLRTGYPIFTNNRVQWGWKGSSTDVGGEYREVSLSTDLFTALRDYGWAIAYHPSYSENRYINIGDVYLEITTSETDYTISYNANGGSGAPSSQTATGVGSATTALSNIKPTKTGYSFEGWSETLGGAAEYQPGGTISVSANTILYAVWKPLIYTITFDPKSGTVSPTTKSVEYNSAYGELPTATRAGYRFDGWFTDPVDGTIITESTIVKLTANQTLYAHWTVQSIVHIMDANGVLHDGIVYFCDGTSMHVGIVYVTDANGDLHVNGQE